MQTQQCEYYFPKFQKIDNEISRKRNIIFKLNILCSPKKWQLLIYTKPSCITCIYNKRQVSHNSSVKSCMLTDTALGVFDFDEVASLFVRSFTPADTLLEESNSEFPFSLLKSSESITNVLLSSLNLSRSDSKRSDFCCVDLLSLSWDNSKRTNNVKIARHRDCVILLVAIAIFVVYYDYLPWFYENKIVR